MAAAAKARVAQTNGKSWHRSVDEGQMTDLNPQSDPNATPEDVATLYSWANLHGAKYRDFSAARAQTREKARLRAEQAQQEEQRHSNLEAEAAEAAAAESAAEQERIFEAGHQAELAAEEA